MGSSLESLPSSITLSPPPPHLRPRGTQMAKAPQPLKVLVVDDDQEICDFMETFLTKDGFEMKTLSDPAEAPDEVKVGGYHLVILDLMMPNMDGVEVLERLRKIDSDVAVVIFTGYPSLDTAVKSMKLDAV